MAILIGTDEAGYGPNLGPLVMTATVWQVPDKLARVDLYRQLRGVVERTCEPQSGSLPIADSKQLYKPGGGLATLERTVLATLLNTGRAVRTWRDVWRMLAPDSAARLEEVPWYADYDRRAPVDTAAEEIGPAAERLAEGLQRHGMRLLDMQSTALFPARFNQLIERWGSKGAVLSQETLHLVRRALDKVDAGSPDAGAAPRAGAVMVQCDKHGGRNRYGALLQAVFPEPLAEVVREGRAESVYRWPASRGCVEFRFAAGGESFLPAALASMTSKYLRELAMQALNAFWTARVPGLRPTAGYPIDARRFKADIAAAMARAGIDEKLLWRSR